MRAPLGYDLDAFIRDLHSCGPYPSEREVPIEAGFKVPDALDDLSAKLTAIEEEMLLDVRRAIELHLRTVEGSPLLNTVPLFRTIGLWRQETAHTHALAWLLDPRQPHGFKEMPFRAFLRAVAKSSPDGPGAAPWRSEQDIFVRRVRPEIFLSRSCRIDLLAEGEFVDGKPWIVLVEAKLGAKERMRQLSDYDSAVRTYLGSKAGDTEILRVFLTEDGRASLTSAEHHWILLDFPRLAREFMALYPLLKSETGLPFLRIYLSGMLEDVCGIKCRANREELIADNSLARLGRVLEVVSA